jgi:DNA mismatch repair protein MutL
MLERGQVPFFLLHLELDPERTDVNVHPTKREIKFENESLVHQVISRMAKEALRAGGANEFVLPESSQKDWSGQTGAAGVSGQRGQWPGIQSDGSISGTVPTGDSSLTSRYVELQGEMFGRADSGPGVNDAEAETGTRLINRLGAGESDQPQMWQIHRKYILAEVQSGLIIVDQHVAHERILYEQALDAFSNRRRDSQRVLFPVKIRFSADEELAFEELAGMLSGLGYAFVKMEEHTWAMEEVPADLKNGAEEKLIHDIIAQYGEHRDADQELREVMAAAFSCKAAIKAGDSLTQAEMRFLVDRLFACRYPYSCPHGRPVVMNLTLEELDKRFGRT